jgi:polygalacturonase
VNCVRDILFENITSHHPLKGIYIKTNPGTTGSGIISNITYRNFEAKHSVWMPIWIGPQQQHQPGKPGTGCSFLFPIQEKCPTQPLVSVSHIYV